MSQLTHVAFEVEPGWLDDVRAALADPSRLAPALTKWWVRREVRLAAATVTLSDDERASLGLAIAPVAIGPVPGTVRRVAADRARTCAQRLHALTGLNAPAILLEHQRAQLLRHAAMIDPAAPWMPEPVPDLVHVPPETEGGAAPVDLHAWLDVMLHAAQADAPDLGVGPLDAIPASGDPPPMADGWEQTTFAMCPDLAAFSANALPHTLALPDGRLVVTEAGGPVTYAVDGDRARVSFVWLATDPAGPWRAY